MGLGIRRETLGDIAVGDGGAVVICLDKVARLSPATDNKPKSIEIMPF